MTPQLHRRAAEALDEIVALRRQVVDHGRETYRRWRPEIERPRFAPSALNLAHYLALRRHDLRDLQRRLMALGISSLGRLESRVLASLDAAATALSTLADTPIDAIRPPSTRQFFAGEARLEANAVELFGPPTHHRSGRIMVTLATEAADDPSVIAAFVRHGADVIRINCAHDDPDRWAAMIRHVDAAGRDSGRRPPVLMDIAGPKVRTAYVLTPPDRSRVRAGDTVLLSREVQPSEPDTPFQMTCTAPEILERISIGDRVSIDDGKLQGAIYGEANGGFLVRIDGGRLGGAKLRSEKGLNFPTADLGLDPLTAKDRDDLDFVVTHADMVGYSFVQTAGHVAVLQDELAKRTADWHRLALVGKIETPRAVRNLPEIIVQAAGRQPFGVMIARGDLAVEMGFERVAEMQEEIMWLCEAAQVPAIWATQVLEDLVKDGLPSRGEMTDAAMAARAECVLLNKGPNVTAAVSVLDRLLARMADHQVKKTPTLRALHAWDDRS
ncbi:pyruvate kinase [Bauldia sp.]|uniref:pyruvate kinase n=1 Tax=Bauldia sp. TaxID=2575872 RepID=UPI003BABB734